VTEDIFFPNNSMWHPVVNIVLVVRIAMLSTSR
jgi:hypothetical protein